MQEQAASAATSFALPGGPFCADRPARAVVMASGGGRTLGSLAAATGDGRLPVRLIGLVSSSPQAGCVNIARDLGLAVRTFDGHPDASAMEGLVRGWGCGGELDQRPADLVILAGYLKKVGVPASLAGRIVNIHPGLLPEFGGKGMYGRRVHEAVLAAGRAVSGCTVHLVDDQYDHGPVLLVRTCPVEPGDTPETLAARVFDLERRAYIDAIGALVRGEGR